MDLDFLESMMGEVEFNLAPELRGPCSLADGDREHPPGPPYHPSGDLRHERAPVGG